MKRTVLLLTVAMLSFLEASQQKKCTKCSVAKDYMRCNYYVLQKRDLSHQNSCLIYAQEMQKAGNNGSASWFYIVAGEFDKAIKSGQKAVKVGEKYALEHIAEAYYLKGDKENSKKYFKLFKKTPHDKFMIEKHFEVLKKLYPKKAEGL